MICTSIRNKTYPEIIEILRNPMVEMAEIRLDLCPLSDEEITDLFENSDTPLLATCHSSEIHRANPEKKPWECDLETERRLNLAVVAGVRFADLELGMSPTISKRFQKLCRNNGTELIRSWHDYEGTPDLQTLKQVLDKILKYGGDVVKIVTTCVNDEDASVIRGLYDCLPEGCRMIAFGMGEKGSASRTECLRRGAPFTFAALSGEEATAPGQPALSELFDMLYPEGRTVYSSEDLDVPASKSFAQRAIVAAALAEGVSSLHSYSPCADSEAAIRFAESLGAQVKQDGNTLVIRGIGPVREPLGLAGINTGESGLLTRLAIPVLAALNGEPFTVDGVGTLRSRALKGAGDIMAAFGVMLTNAENRSDRELHIPLNVRGKLIPGTADIPGSGGSQLISGLLMALPLCEKSSTVYVSDPKSIPYMYITLDVLRHFGIKTRSEMEGDARMLQEQDWSCCTGMTFNIEGGQRYKAAEFDLEKDWSAAANFMVAGAVFGKVVLNGLDTSSIQADLGISDILVNAGASVSQTEDGSICVRKAPLEGFEADLTHSPDLFPIVSVLAAFCDGTSVLSGAGRLVNKESNRAAAIIEMLGAMGVEAVLSGDSIVVRGETLASRSLNGRLLKGGEFSSHGDHRIVMALKVAELGASSPIRIDDEACVAKSFPGFRL